MGRIPEETIQAIRDRIDIVALIGRYVDLKKAGRNHKGRCPFHEEKTPSFNVNPDRQIFHCFGCQVGGNVMKFLMLYENLSFPEAVRTLASECGVEVPETDSGDRGVSEQLFSANQHAQSFHRRELSAAGGSGALAYLRDRGIDDEAIETFGIGYAPDSWDELAGVLKRAGVSEQHGIESGLLIERESKPGQKSGGRNSYARLRGRVVFPIRDVRDRIVGFGGRAISPGQEPKYLTTPESPVFQKRNALYGFPSALEGIRKSGRAIVCEGYFDRIALARAGMTEGVATCGTALTEGHARELSRRTSEIVLLFDGDTAGQSAVEKALHTVLPAGLRVRAAMLPSGDDPDSFLNSQGPDALRKLVDQAPDAIEIVIQNAVKRGCSTPAQKAAVVSHVSPMIALFANPVERIEYAAQDGQLDDSGAIDLELLEDRLDSEASARLRSVAVDDLGEDSESSPARMLEDLLGWFAKRRRSADGDLVTQQLRDPNADVDDLLARKQKQLEEKRRAALGVPNPTTQ